METMSFNDIFAKMFQFKSPVVDAQAPAATQQLGQLAGPGRAQSEGRSDDQETVDNPCPSLSRYQEISPDFERHGAIVRLTNLEAFKNAFPDVMTLFPLAKTTLSVRKDPLVNVLHVILVDEHSEETNLLEQAEAYLKLVGQSLRSHNIRHVTFSARPQNIENISAHNADMALYPNIYTV
ncbi:hypothetical protein DVH05_024484 [Phytophthora capsici]|nr:hypothetical protein DVH05_024484 [Phytophthora capsici]